MLVWGIIPIKNMTRAHAKQTLAAFSQLNIYGFFCSTKIFKNIRSLINNAICDCET